MKKLTIIFAVAFATLSISSCKKDYTCTCTLTTSVTQNSTTNTTSTVSTVEIKEASKHDASLMCLSTEQTDVDGVAPNIVTTVRSESCELE